MLCPQKWNDSDPAALATDLLRSAVRSGQIAESRPGRLPKFVFVRDPDDKTIVYRAHLMSEADGTYEAYPLTDAEIDDLEVVPP
jgi:hypothetical protein